MNKIAIALDILRQYNEYLEVSGKETKIYAIDGYGERVSFKALIYGYWYVFSSIYGSNESWYGYPKDMYWNMLWGDGIIGWNRPVTNPTIDIPKALTIYTQLNSSAASYKDKFSRETAFKKLFYRDGSYAHNVFIDSAIQTDDDGYIQTAGSILQKEDPDFYEYVNNKLYDLWDLAANEAKNVSVPTKLKFLFDNKPVAKMYDALPEDESYKDGLLNMNSSVIQANQFYLTFLTSFEQIVYQYTKQTFPIKLFGTLANLYSSYVKLITNYVKPYHARLIDKAPIMRFGGGLEESIAVGDIMRLDPTVQIFSDVVRWRFDNPYDYRPDEYDKLDKIWDEFWLGGKPTDDSSQWDGIIYYDDAPESGIVQIIEDKEHYYHRIDDSLLYTDNKLHQNDIYEDITINEDRIHINNRPSFDNIPFNLYPASLYSKFTIDEHYNYILNELISYDWVTGCIENISNRDLCIITDLYNDKDEYKISDIKFNLKNLDDIDLSYSKIGLFVNDMNHLLTFNEYTIRNKDNTTHSEWLWRTTKLPVISDIFNRIDPPKSLHDIMIFQDSRNNPITYHPVSVSPCLYLSDNETFCKYSDDLPYKNKLIFGEDGSIKLPVDINKGFNFIKFFLYIPAHSKAVLPEIDYTGRKKI